MPALRRQALRWRDAAVRMAPSVPDARDGQCALQAELGLLDMAESCLAAMMDDFPRVFLPGVTATDLAINVQRGEHQAAAEALLTATETSAIQSWWIFLAPARRLPRQSRFAAVRGGRR